MRVDSRMVDKETVDEDVNQRLDRLGQLCTNQRHKIEELKVRLIHIRRLLDRMEKELVMKMVCGPPSRYQVLWNQTRRQFKELRGAVG